MRIVIFSEYFYPDPAGTGRLLAELARALSRDPRGFAVTALASVRQFRGGTLPLTRQEDWEGGRVRRFAAPNANRAKALQRLASDLLFTTKSALAAVGERADVNVVVTNPSVLPLACLAIKAMRGTPYVYIIHDLFPDVAITVGVVREGGTVERLARAIQRSFLHNAAKVVVLGRCMADTIADRYGLPRDHIAVIPNFPTLARAATQEDRQALRRREGWEGFVCLYSGNLGQFQDFDTLLEAARLLRDGGDPVTLAFAGSGARRPQVEERARQENLTNVRFLPFVSDEEFPALLAACDAALVTLEQGAEGLGVPSKFYNLLAAGRPIVAVMGPNTEVSYVIEESGCGEVVPQKQPERLAATLRRLADSPAELAQMGEAGKRLAEERYSLSSAADALAGVLNEASRAQTPFDRRGAVGP